jgi:hypothetical protein
MSGMEQADKVFPDSLKNEMKRYERSLPENHGYYRFLSKLTK